MKLAEDVLLEIVAAVQKGLSEGRDVSDLLRELDVEPEGDKVRMKKNTQNGQLDLFRP